MCQSNDLGQSQGSRTACELQQQVKSMQPEESVSRAATSDFSANVHIPGQDVGSQASCDQVNSATSTSSLLVSTADRSTNTELFTSDKGLSCHPTLSDFACVARVFVGINAQTNTESSDFQTIHAHIESS